MSDAIIASSLTVPDHPLLHGFAFSGVDFIVGDDGARAVGGVSPGSDGAYVSVTPMANGRTTIGTDGAGYAKLFFYQSDSNWVAGRSLIATAEYAASNDWPLEADDVELAALELRSGMISQQLISDRTVFKQIRLLSPMEEIVITNAREAHIRKRASEHVGDYATALGAGVSLLVGRMATLLNAKVPLVSDLSGGRDSRVILAALRYASGGKRTLSTVRFRSNPRRSEDYAVARKIARLNNFPLNGAPLANPTKRAPREAFDLWRTHDLGVYHPIYPAVQFGGEVALSGASGGAHRSVYRGANLAESLHSLKTALVPPRVMASLVERAHAAVAEAGEGADAQLAHFRLFRNRIHGGRNSLRDISIAPLAAQSLVRASNALGERGVRRAQFYADIMLNLAPDLARLKYDSPEKDWDPGHFRDASMVVMDDELNGGNVYGSLTRRRELGPNPDENVIAPYLDAFVEARHPVRESGILSESTIEKAENALSEASDRYFAHAADAAPVSHVLLVNEVLKLA